MSFTWLAFNPSLAFPPLLLTPPLLPPSATSHQVLYPPPPLHAAHRLPVCPGLNGMRMEWVSGRPFIRNGKKREVKRESGKKESERRASSLIHLSQSSCPEAREVGRIRWGERALLMPGMCVCLCTCLCVKREREREACWENQPASLPSWDRWHPARTRFAQLSEDTKREQVQ